MDTDTQKSSLGTVHCSTFKIEENVGWSVTIHLIRQLRQHSIVCYFLFIRKKAIDAENDFTMTYSMDCVHLEEDVRTNVGSTIAKPIVTSLQKIDRLICSEKNDTVDITNTAIVQKEPVAPVCCCKFIGDYWD